MLEEQLASLRSSWGLRVLARAPLNHRVKGSSPIAPTSGLPDTSELDLKTIAELFR
jgi:hypothetical protein